MERRVTVNDRIERVEIEVPEDLQPLESSEELAVQPENRSRNGPCLYLGPAGERCAKTALEGGYCAKHHPDPSLQDPGRSYGRVVVAAVALVAIAWPYIADVVRALLRLFSPAE